ncbi:AAA domain-containing protein [Fimicolochytrium jonesii]|uniref:AAA domain-containing protein n=1 Tax=Fimicolochytrium jonesii TaxID=1396493 RepID=UPI0022FDEF23|nr:AAA domain-containing protein [Fimicolochytrium jonesii]KAI8817757.1 AAA domain-containing protein [Fimicolochytrium jonesii]
MELNAELASRITSHLTARDNPPLVIMMCGIAGSGKTTTAKSILSAFPDTFTRLSIDDHIWTHYGRYGIDYTPAEYESLQDKAEAALDVRLVELLKEGRNVVLDYSFWEKRDRERYRGVIEECGGRALVVHLSVPKDVLRERLEKRGRERFDADAAWVIDDKTLDTYWEGFQVPHGEGELVISNFVEP